MRDLGHVEIGSLPRLTGTITQSKTPADPSPLTLLKFRITSPVSHTVTSYTFGTGEIVHTGTGVFYVQINVNETGVWYGRWHVDNPNAGQTVDDFAFVCDAAGDSTLYP